MSSVVFTHIKDMRNLHDDMGTMSSVVFTHNENMRNVPLVLHFMQTWEP